MIIELMRNAIILNYFFKNMKDYNLVLSMDKWEKQTGLSKKVIVEIGKELRSLSFLKQSKKGNQWGLFFDLSEFKIKLKNAQSFIDFDNFEEDVFYAVRFIAQIHDFQADSDDKKEVNAVHTPKPKKRRQSVRKVNNELSHWAAMASQLAHAIKTCRKVNMNSKINKWAIHFRRLVEVDRIELKRVKKVLDWYCVQLKNGLPLFTPQAYSGDSFRSKFLRIEDAIFRQEEDEELTFEELTLKQQIQHKKMETNLQHSKYTDIDTLPSLIQTLARHLIKSRRCVKETVYEEATKKLYLESLFSVRVYFVAYSMWIEKEVGRWKGWLGNLDGFKPGEKHFKRYIEYTIRRSGMTKTKKLKRILDETKKD